MWNTLFFFLKKQHCVKTLAHSHINQSSQNRKEPELRCPPPPSQLQRLRPSPPRRVKELNGPGTFSISTKAPQPAQINQQRPLIKVTFSAALECNYHVLNSLTPPSFASTSVLSFLRRFFFFSFSGKDHTQLCEGRCLVFLFRFFFLTHQRDPHQSSIQRSRFSS